VATEDILSVAQELCPIDMSEKKVPEERLKEWEQRTDNLRIGSFWQLQKN